MAAKVSIQDRYGETTVRQSSRCCIRKYANEQYPQHKNDRDVYERVLSRSIIRGYVLPRTFWIGILFVVSILLSPMTVTAQQQWQPPSVNGPRVQKVLFSLIPDPNSRINALVKGDIDALMFGQMGGLLTTTQIQQLQSTPNVVVSSVPGASFYHMVFNMRPSPPVTSKAASEAMNDVNFRQAFAYLVDRNRIVSDIFAGKNAIPIYSYFWPEKDGEWTNPNIQKYPTDLAKANSILDSAGYKYGADGWRTTPSGLSLSPSLSYISSDPVATQMALLIASWAGQAKIKIQLRAIDMSVLRTEVAGTKQFDMYLWQTAAGSGGTDPTLYQVYLYNGNKLGISPFQYPGINDTTLNKLFEDIVVNPDRTKVKQDVWDVQSRMADLAPIILLVSPNAIDVYRTDRFTGWVTQPVLGVMNSYWTYLNVRPLKPEYDTLRIGLPGIVGVNVASTIYQSEPTTRQIFGLLYSPVMGGGNGYQGLFTPYIPLLAESYTITPTQVKGQDGEIIKYNLVKNATWSDGVKFTSKDVAFTFMYWKNQSWPDAVRVYPFIDHVETPDDYTVSAYVTTRAYFYVFQLSTIYAPIIPEHIFRNIAKASDYPNANPVVVGPFLFDSYKQGEYLQFKANPNYYHPALAPTTMTSQMTSQMTTGPSTSDYVTPMLIVLAVIVIGIVVWRKRSQAKNSRTE